jgi:hypothetical protein
MASQIRLELSTTNPDLQDGLQARMHDPLWLLARQWQFGEFNGADAGSPAAAQVVVDMTTLSRYQPGPQSASNPARPYAPETLALETLVESESFATDSRPTWKLTAEAGNHLLRLLYPNGAGQTRALWLASAYVLAPPTADQERTLDAVSLQFIQVMSRRTIDGLRLAAHLRPLRDRNGLAELFQETPFEQITPTDQPKVIAALTAWLTWADRFFQQTAPPAAWMPERMEYAFAVSGKTTAGEVVLAAPEYLEGRLDWFSFVASPGQTLGATASTSSVNQAFLPPPVTFRGMPSARFWEFEDGAVNFAKVEAAPQDLARLLLVKFALEYSNDWFVLPLELAVGTLCQIRALIITNTFGERLVIPHSSQVDGAASPWRMFQLSGDTQQLYFLPPVLGPGLESPPVEEVLFLRDEMANVAWGVEKIVESAAGRPLDRYEAYQETRRRQEEANPPQTPEGDETQPLPYRLGTTVPDYWIPLLPVREGTSLKLKRGAIPDFNAGEPHRLIEPQGRILEPGRELLLQEEEVPREGARVTRTYQYARWIDGSTHLWIGRRKEPGRGEGSSGLQFDVAERRESE